jgi:hypothetical protein
MGLGEMGLGEMVLGEMALGDMDIHRSWMPCPLRHAESRRDYPVTLGIESPPHSWRFGGVPSADLKAPNQGVRIFQIG